MSLLTKKKPTRRPSRARAAEQATAPVRQTPRSGPTQAELRGRRRGALRVAYAGEFVLSEEIAAICGPPAARIAGLSDVHDERGLGMMFSATVSDLLDAVHGELITGVVGWLAELDARERVQRDGAHLDTAERKQAVRHLMDIAPRPAEPIIEPADLVSGRWVDALIALAAPFDHRLADLLGRAHPPGHPELRGLDSRSDKLVELLREVDQAARQLELRIERAERSAVKLRAGCRPATPATRAEAARKALSNMGIEVPTP